MIFADFAFGHDHRDFFTAAMAGFVVGNEALIIGGALVGAAGFILTMLMGEAMNRSLANVLFSGFGTEGAGPVTTSDKPVKSATPDDVAIALAYADTVMVVPGYGMAVAQAQHALKELTDILDEKEIEIKAGELGLGKHQIKLKVQDNEGNWSREVESPDIWVAYQFYNTYLPIVTR